MYQNTFSGIPRIVKVMTVDENVKSPTFSFKKVGSMKGRFVRRGINMINTVL